jgi:hypothetical protein
LKNVCSFISGGENDNDVILGVPMQKFSSNQVNMNFMTWGSGRAWCPIMFTPARDFLLETPWRIIIPNSNVNSHSL